MLFYEANGAHFPVPYDASSRVTAGLGPQMPRLGPGVPMGFGANTPSIAARSSTGLVPAPAPRPTVTARRESGGMTAQFLPSSGMRTTADSGGGDSGGGDEALLLPKGTPIPITDDTAKDTSPMPAPYEPAVPELRPVDQPSSSQSSSSAVKWIAVGSAAAAALAITALLIWGR